MIPISGAVASVLRASKEFDENTVTPGVLGFVAIFLVAAATILLGLDMVRRIRRTRYRGEIREQLGNATNLQAGRPADSGDRDGLPSDDRADGPPDDGPAGR